MKNKLSLLLLASILLLVAIVIVPIQHLEKGSTYKPFDQHGGV
ncbi:cell division protein FtsL [Paenibacillus sp. RC62]